jgi:hypothetical protein
MGVKVENKKTQNNSPKIISKESPKKVSFFKKYLSKSLKVFGFLLKVALPFLIVALIIAILTLWLKTRWTNATSVSLLLVGGTIVTKKLLMAVFEKLKVESANLTKKSTLKTRTAT